MKSTISIRRVLLGLCGLLVFIYASGFIWVWGRAVILPAVPATLAAYDPTRVPVVYHPLYNISLLGIEQLHPFDTFKYQKVFDGLVAAGRFTADDIYHPPYATIAMLERVHDPDYLDRIKQAAAIAKMTEVTPLSLLPAGVLQKAVLDAQRLATGGTVLAAELALAHGWAINLGGGYHHAAPHHGWGFSAYNDVAIAWQHLKSERNLQRVMIIDLDAHQGDGTGYALGDDPDAYLFDAYNPYVFPNDPLGAAGVDYKMHVAPGTEGDAYLAALEKGLAEAFDAFVPDVVFYLAGSDVLQGDPLGGLKLTSADIVARDSLVVEHVRALNHPLVVVLSGGYLPNNGATIARSLDTLWPALDGTPLQ